jgi:hypothetical protein
MLGVAECLHDLLENKKNLYRQEYTAVADWWRPLSELK